MAGTKRKLKTSKAHRDRVNRWRAANKAAIAAAEKEGITLAAWRLKNGVAVKHAKKKPVAKPAPAEPTV